jgi:hypothetical protein
MLGDRMGHLHAFWIQNPMPERDWNQTEAITYARWDGMQWSPPLEVLVTPSGGVIDSFSIALDDADRLHVLIRHGYYVYYTQTSLPGIERHSSWSAPDTLLVEPLLGASIRMVGDALYVTYLSATPPYGLYAITSDDAGLSWSAPDLLYTLGLPEEEPTSTSLTIQPEGVLHLAWSYGSRPDSYPPLGIRYARSMDGGRSWTQPLLLQEGGYGLPALRVAAENTVYLTYNGISSVTGRYFHWSSDGGQTWSEQILIAPGVGGLTGGTMALDSAGTLHYASAADTGPVNGVAYTQWDGARWSRLVDLTKTRVEVREGGRQGYEPRMMVSHGNRLHAVYIGADHDDVFYVTAQTDAPAVPLPTSLPTQQPTPEPTRTKAAATPTPSFQIDETSALTPTAGEQSTAGPIVLAVVPVILLLSVVLVLRVAGRTRR